MIVPVISDKLAFDESNEPFFMFQDLEYQDIDKDSPRTEAVEVEKKEEKENLRWWQFALAHQDN